MAKVVKGSAIFDDEGGMVFNAYIKGKPENVTWCLLKQHVDGKSISKLECSKSKIKATITFDRGDLNALAGKFNRAVSVLVTAMLKDKAVQKKYEMAEKLKPCEIENESSTEEEIPTHGY